MNIIHVSPVFLPYRSGMSNVVYTQARELAYRGHNIVVLTPLYNKAWKSEEILDGIQVIRFNPFIHFGNASFSPVMNTTLKRLVKNNREKSIIHIHTPFFGGAELLWFIKILGFLKKEALVVFYHHDPQFGLLRDTVTYISKKILHLLIRSADTVMVSSLDYAQHSALASVIDDRFIEIPFGIDTERFVPNSKFKIQNSNNILFVGALDKAHHFKGLDILLKAFSQLSIVNCRLSIVGSGDLFDEYKKQTYELGLADRVTFHGFVSDKDLPLYYQKADIFVFSSTGKAEAFGLVALEAMSSGLPVIASDLPGVRSVIDDPQMLVKPGDSVLLAEKLNWALNDSRVRARMGERNRERVLDRYSLEVVMDKLEAVYLEMRN